MRRTGSIASDAPVPSPRTLTGPRIEITAHGVCGADTWTRFRGTGSPHAMAPWSRSPSGFAPAATGRSSTAAGRAVSWNRTGLPGTTTSWRSFRSRYAPSPRRRFPWSGCKLPWNPGLGRRKDRPDRTDWSYQKGYFTMRTAQCAWWAMRSEMLPRRKRSTAPAPWLPSTMSSVCSSFATRKITSAGENPISRRTV